MKNNSNYFVTLKLLSGFFLIALFCISNLVSAASPTEDFANIPWQLVGSSALSSGDRIILTPNIGGEGGAMWDPCQINITEDFDLVFGINLGTNACGADGIAFVLQNDADNLVGGNTGVHDDDGISNSLDIAFDTFSNTVAPYSDPPYDSLNIEVDGNVPNAGPTSCGGAGVIGGPTACGRPPISATEFDIKDGQDHIVEIQWTASTQTINVTVDGNLRATWILPADYATSIFNGNNVWFGFTGSTGGFYNVQEAGLISGTADNNTVDVTSNPCNLANTPVPPLGSPTPYAIPTNYCGTPTNMPTLTVSPTQSYTFTPSPTFSASPTPYPTTCGTPVAFNTMAVLAGGQSGNNVPSQTYSFGPTGTALDAVVLVWISQSNSDTPVSTVFYGATQMTLYGSNTNTSYGGTQSLYWATYTGLTGNQNVVINFSGNSNDNQWVVEGMVVTGVNQTNPFGNQSDTQSSSNNSFTDTLSTANPASMVLDLLDNNQSLSGRLTLGGGQTTTGPAGDSSGPHAYGDYEIFPAPGPQNFTYTWGSSGQTIHSWMIELVQATCGTPTDTPIYSPTSTGSPSNTAGPTNTPTATPSQSSTSTISPTAVPTTAGPTPTDTPTSSPTGTPAPPTASPGPTPTSFQIVTVYPNPVPGSGTNIVVSMPFVGTVTFKIYDLRGETIWTATTSTISAPYVTYLWPATNNSGAAVSYGAYYLVATGHSTNQQQEASDNRWLTVVR